jgi:hypothetical protein
MQSGNHLNAVALLKADHRKVKDYFFVRRHYGCSQKAGAG